MTESNHMIIWEQVEKTDPDFARGFDNGTFSGTAINPSYNYEKATRIFGPIGIGWGFDIEENKYTHGAPMVDKEGVTHGPALTHTMQINLWYNHEGEKRTVPGIGQTPYVTLTANGKFRTDHEAEKKSLTDAIGKALSLLGFSSDVYKGLFDNAEYLGEIRDEFAVEKSDDKAQELIRQKAAYNDEKNKHLEQMADAVTIPELYALYVAITRKADRRKDAEGLKVIQSTYEKAKADLEAKK